MTEESKDTPPEAYAAGMAEMIETGRVKSRGVISGRFGPTEAKAAGGFDMVIYETPKPPEAHVHRWAWADRTDGTCAQLCYGCGKERR